MCTVLHYLEKECLIADLVKANILFIDENGTLPTKWQGNKEGSAEILLHEDGTTDLIRRAETLDDLFATLDFSKL